MPALGFVIPALNEAERLPDLLADLARLDQEHVVVVVDGGSEDDTARIVSAAGARLIAAARGRARQLNAGAEALESEWYCFLHADVRMPEAARRELQHTVRDSSAEAAVWRLAIAAPGAWFRIVEFGAYVRDQVGGLAYGDQGLLIRRELFERVGGYPDVPLMEDVAIVRKVRRQARLRRLRSPLVASARRWLREGPYRTWFRNVALTTAYLAGVDPARLARWYRPEPRP